MKKPETLRTMLLASVPALAKAPDHLSMFIEKGRVAARGTRSLNYEYRYTLTIYVEDYADDVDAVFVPVLGWIAENQPDLLDRDKQEPFTFEADILETGSADIEIKIELTERVRVTRQDDGLKVTHLSDAPIADEFTGVPADTRLVTGLADDLAGLQ